MLVRADRMCVTGIVSMLLHLRDRSALRTPTLKMRRAEKMGRARLSVSGFSASQRPSYSLSQDWGTSLTQTHLALSASRSRSFVVPSVPPLHRLRRVAASGRQPAGGQRRRHGMTTVCEWPSGVRDASCHPLPPASDHNDGGIGVVGGDGRIDGVGSSICLTLAPRRAATTALGSPIGVVSLVVADCHRAPPRLWRRWSLGSRYQPRRSD